MNKVLQYYREQGIITEIKTMKHMVKGLPKDIKSIVSAVQNIFIHQHWAKSYGLELDDKRRQESWIRSVEEKLIFLNNKGYNHVLDKKDLSDKMASICRDFSVMAVALCREVGIPARARCGFATYFEKDKYIDHWVLEYWNEEEKRWILVDAQLDEFQQEKLNISFDTLDVGEGDFITGPRAWIMCREGRANPEAFGIFDMWGYDYLNCNLMLDINSLLKVPMQPWDVWEGYKGLPVEQWGHEDYLFMDKLVSYALDVDNDLQGLMRFVEDSNKIKVPKDLSKVTNVLE